MLWQAEAGFRFRLADAWLSPVVPDGVPDRDVLTALHNDEQPGGGGATLVRLAHHLRADVIMVDAEHAEPWRALVVAGGLEAHSIGGVRDIVRAARLWRDLDGDRATPAGRRQIL